MEHLRKKVLFFIAMVGLGITANHLIIQLIIKLDYVVRTDYLNAIIYSGGILWGVISTKILNAKEEHSMDSNRIPISYLEELNQKNTLTNLPNKISLEKRFEEMLGRSPKENFNILCIDVDGFKMVNDTLGYEIGDQILVRIAERLKKTINKEGELFHIRGDEFVLLIQKEDSMEKIQKLSETIIKAMAMSFVFSEKEIHLTVSVGIAGYPWGGSNLNLLLQNAHIAVQAAKESSKSKHLVYDDSMNIKMNRKLELINNLHKALEKKEFELYYQPQIDSETNEIVGLEALLRWQNPTLGRVSPAEFIPVAEETGLIIPIGDWVLKTACAQNATWQKEGYKPIPVSVNISTIQFNEPLFVDKVVTILKETTLNPKWLHLEITESVAINDATLTINVLNRLQKIGVKIALDDFGTGFSSLGYLSKFKINVLKIDSSFVQDIGEDESTITKTIIVLGKNLNMEVVAEGVETNEQLDYLKNAGCDIIQGYLFSSPLPAGQIEKMFKLAA
ncbi:putative bifunctional diguanylate cyclase/phosphodiesterase [Alkaliphilus oremlandii]|uniref:Diguanylate cyclase/phosphodiesterase n=1 Tax=Alkaliphilus oremlandii (strain OhILAs) TaxID=350688 RepID=A8MJT4_ALKOO|nr:bifunctional diguanylate cyclase/phosphodiesterase [Alkaliphilus oremlandii]ABW20066.1 diguanylate cyclase/phosphodiesterase [Alkaliphilus oremlandii OhILAs]